MIIAIKEKDRVVIGHTITDTVEKATKQDYVDEENLAIAFSPSGKIFACADMNRSADVLLYDDILLNMDSTPKSIVQKMIPYMKERLKASGKPIDENGGWQNALVLCDNGHIYDIGPKFAFREVEDYLLHGYKETATIISVLDETTTLSSEERIIKAVSFASKLHRVNLFPIIITDTKTKNVKRIYEGENGNEYFDSL